MARKEIFLDCTKLVRGSRWGKRMIPRLRQYCRSRFADFDLYMSDEDLFVFLYAKNTSSSLNNEMVRLRASNDYTKWFAGEPAPEYVCSWLRVAMKDRDHYPIQRCQTSLAA